MNKVITIGREHGSGGRAVGTIIAEKLGIECYDTRIITEAAKRSGINEKLFHAYNERSTDSLLYSLAMSVKVVPGISWEDQNRSLPEQICKAQFEVIKEFAQKPCVIVGRCADYILDDTISKCRVFIRAEKADRIARIMETYQVSAKDAEHMISRTDKERSSYYHFYTNQRWGDCRNYDLCLSTSGISIQDAADLIINYMEKKSC
ncbi:MAG: cytidylate kinase-like family protein [Lachnospiraceae bacterium]|nr:cytidylate kinase-like family protein [Lachnospiraceae bacterium]